MAFQFTQLAYQISTLFKVFLPDVIRGDTHQPFMNLVLLEICDRRLYTVTTLCTAHFLGIKNHLCAFVRNSTSVRPHINTERFKSSFFNILIFKYNLLYMIFRLLKTLIFLFIVTSDMYFYLMNKDSLLLLLLLLFLS